MKLKVHAEGLFCSDDNARHRRRSDSRTERGYPPVTPVACLRDSVLSAVFDDLMKKVTFVPAQLTVSVSYTHLTLPTIYSV